MPGTALGAGAKQQTTEVVNTKDLGGNTYRARFWTC